MALGRNPVHAAPTAASTETRKSCVTPARAARRAACSGQDTTSHAGRDTTTRRTSPGASKRTCPPEATATI
eukprot:15482840-Alexandrium_andersonii.AAC.1